MCSATSRPPRPSTHYTAARSLHRTAFQHDDDDDALDELDEHFDPRVTNPSIQKRRRGLSRIAEREDADADDTFQVNTLPPSQKARKMGRKQWEVAE